MSDAVAMKWLKKAVDNERHALERARRRFVRKPKEASLHDVRTTGRRFRSLLEDVETLLPSKRLHRRVKRAAAATDAARDATIILQLLETSVDAGERQSAHELLERLRDQEARATQRACAELGRICFT